MFCGDKFEGSNVLLLIIFVYFFFNGSVKLVLVGKINFIVFVYFFVGRCLM